MFNYDENVIVITFVDLLKAPVKMRVLPDVRERFSVITHTFNTYNA